MTPAGEVHAIQLAVAKSFVQVHLRALRNYRNAAEDGLAHALQDCAVSVAHAEATLKEFDHECPTPREIKDIAWNLRDRYLARPSQEELWKAQGYTHDPTFRDSLLATIPKAPVLKAAFSPIAGIPANYEQALELLSRRASGQLSPSLDELMWRAIKNRLRVVDFGQVPLGQCWHAAYEMGFPLSVAQTNAMEHWLATQPSTVVPPLHSPVPSPTITPKEQPQCTQCAGTGRTEDGYCKCPTGRDLARVESPYQASDANEEITEEPV